MAEIKTDENVYEASDKDQTVSVSRVNYNVRNVAKS